MKTLAEIFNEEYVYIIEEINTRKTTANPMDFFENWEVVKDIVEDDLNNEIMNHIEEQGEYSEEEFQKRLEEIYEDLKPCFKDFLDYFKQENDKLKNEADMDLYSDWIDSFWG